MRLIIVITCLCLGAIEDCVATDEGTLYKFLFESYNPKVRPLKQATDIIHVYLEFELKQIQELDEKSQILSTVGFFTAVWRDEYIKWNPVAFGGIDVLVMYPHTVWLPDFGIENRWRDEYLKWKPRKRGGISSLVVSPRNVWLPDMVLMNSADTFYHSEFTTDFRVEIHHDGNITWSFGGVFKTMCLLDNTYYPLDLQKCSLNLENWAYTGTQVDIHPRKAKIDTENYQNHGIWHVESSDVQKEYLEYASHPNERFPQMKFDLHLKRKSTYYVLNILIPCGFIIIVALTVFWLPPDAGEKVSFGVTVLLAFSVFQLVIAEQTPVNSDYRPKLSLLVLSIMGLSSGSVVISILILYLHHKSTATRVPRWMRVFAFRGLATVLCMRKSMPDVADDDHKVAPDDTEGDMLGEVNPPVKGGPPGEIGEILGCMKYITKRMKDKDNDTMILEEWQALGKVIDRIFFWLSLVAIIVTCGVLLAGPP